MFAFFSLWEKTTSSAGVLGETAKPEQYYDCSPKKSYRHFKQQMLAKNAL